MLLYLVRQQQIVVFSARKSYHISFLIICKMEGIRDKALRELHGFPWKNTVVEPESNSSHVKAEGLVQEV